MTPGSAGVLPTPAASILVRRHGLDLAAVVSASHNPWQHNGIKFFGPDGRKLDDELEAADRGAGRRSRVRERPSVGRVRELDGALDDYLRALLSAFQLDLVGAARRCSTAPTARPTGRRPRGSSASGAAVEAIGVEPDGRNINEGCGSIHPERLAEAHRRQRRRDRLRLRRRRRPGDRGGPRRARSATATS